MLCLEHTLAGNVLTSEIIPSTNLGKEKTRENNKQKKIKKQKRAKENKENKGLGRSRYAIY